MTATSVKIFADINGVRHTVNYSLARKYVQQLKAPVKGFYTFSESAHSPAMEEPQKAQWIMREDVLKGASDLADDPLADTL
jgi:hypothetical protein